ncbi:MAG: hypothetical protein ACI4M9_03530 [Succinivibrio sp.]
MPNTIKQIAFAIFAIAGILAINGCSSSSREINTQFTVIKNTNAASDKSVLITDVTDSREFNKTLENSTKPVELRNVNLSRLYALTFTQDGTFLGPVLLPEFQTIESLVKLAVEKAFSDNGYRILSSDGEADSNTLRAKIHITKFWTWKPYTELRLISEIESTIEVTDTQGEIKSFKVYAANVARSNSSTHKKSLKVTNTAYEYFYTNTINAIRRNMADKQ